MDRKWMQFGFGPADILLPKTDDMQAWSVVACDQYTSEPEYWDRVEKRVGDHPSSFRLILPEQKLTDGHTAEHIEKINSTMEQYLAEDLFQLYPDSLIYVERQLFDGKIRRGLVGQADLEAYDYHAGASSLIRATERTVLDRIPPRVAVRRNAALELPHVMMLVDDAACSLIEPLTFEKENMKKVYDFELMEQGGHITGYLVNKEQKQRLLSVLKKLSDPQAFAEKYRARGKAPLLFAVGDGNHSLASAKVNYIEKSGSAKENSARYALVELVNLHDTSLEFEAIHRVVTRTDPENMIRALKTKYPELVIREPGRGDSGNREDPENQECRGSGIPRKTESDIPKGQVVHTFTMVTKDREYRVSIPHPVSHLCVGTLQTFLDEYVRETEAGIDYIHGEQVVRNLCLAEDTVGFLLPAMQKEELYPTVIHDGVLPRKTFSMGEAHDKRFYLEARKL